MLVIITFDKHSGPKTKAERKKAAKPLWKADRTRRSLWEAPSTALFSIRESTLDKQLLNAYNPAV